MSDRKPRNYFSESTPEQQEAHRRLDAMILEAEKHKKIGEAVNMFESFQRWLKTADSNSEPKPTRLIPKANPMPPRPRPKTRRRWIEETGPSLEEIMLATGLVHVVKRKQAGK